MPIGRQAAGEILEGIQRGGPRILHWSGCAASWRRRARGQQAGAGYQLVPAEPAGWANWGLLALRQRNFDPAAERLERARSLAPENDQIYYLLGLLESGRGRSAEAVAALRKAVEINPQNLLATYKLAEEIERQGDENSEAEYQQLIQKMLEVQPDNLAVLLELGRIAAKRGDADTLRGVVAKLADALIGLAAGSPAATQRRTDGRNWIRRAPGSDADHVSAQCAGARARSIGCDLSAIKPPPGEEAVPFTHFLEARVADVWSRAGRHRAHVSQPKPCRTRSITTQWNWAGAISSGRHRCADVVAARTDMKCV